MMEAAPAAPFVVTKPDLLLELLIVALDAPAQLGQIDEPLEADVLRQRGAPVFGWLCFPPPAFEQPATPATAFRGSVCCTRRGHARARSARIAGRPSLPATS